MTTWKRLKIWGIVETYIPAKHHNERRKLLQDIIVLLNDVEHDAVERTIFTWKSRPLWRRVYLAFLNKF